MAALQSFESEASFPEREVQKARMLTRHDASVTVMQRLEVSEVADSYPWDQNRLINQPSLRNRKHS